MAVRRGAFAVGGMFAAGDAPRLAPVPAGEAAAVQNDARSVDAAHARPDGASDELVEAAGKLSAALEHIERVRGHFYTLHQLVGTADLMLDEVVDGLREAGRDDLAKQVEEELLGANLLPGRWTFQIVEEFDDGYYATFKAVEKRVRDQTMDGRRHVLEAEMKQARRTHGRKGHEATPAG